MTRSTERCARWLGTGLALALVACGDNAPERTDSALVPSSSATPSAFASAATSAWPAPGSTCAVRKCKPRPLAEWPRVEELPFEEMIAQQLQAENDRDYFYEIFRASSFHVFDWHDHILEKVPESDFAKSLAFPPFDELFAKRRPFVEELYAWREAREWMQKTTRPGFASPLQLNHGFLVPFALADDDTVFYGWNTDRGPVLIAQTQLQLTFILPPTDDLCEDSPEGRTGLILLTLRDVVALPYDVCAPGALVSEEIRGLTWVHSTFSEIKGWADAIQAVSDGSRVIMTIAKVVNVPFTPQGGPGPPPRPRGRAQWF